MSMIIGEGGPNDKEALKLYTRKGRFIPNLKRLESPPARMKVATEKLKKAFPSAQLRSATQVYNCMGLAFASRRTCIDPVHLAIILDDDEYRQIPGVQETEVGDIVVYGNSGQREATHIGVIVKKETDLSRASWRITVMSQWGADGEYLHPIEEVPLLLGAPQQFWTDRRMLA